MRDDDEMSEPTHDYRARQAVRDAEYREAYTAWVQAMSPKQRATLKASGLDQPLLQKHGNGMLEHDAADSPLASERAPDFEMVEEPREAPPTTTPDGGREAIFDVLRRLIAEVLAQPNARLTLECLALACGLTTLQGESMSSIAKRHGLSRAAVSKRCVDITERLTLPPSRAMRSKQARATYRRAQLAFRQLHERSGDSQS